MSLNRRAFLAGTTAMSFAGAGALAQSLSDEVPIDPLLFSLVSHDPQIVYGSLAIVLERGGTDLVTSLIFASRYGIPGAFDEVLQRLTGADRRGWFDWMVNR